MGKKELSIPITPRNSYVACIEKAREKANIIVPGDKEKTDLRDVCLIVAAWGDDVEGLNVGDEIAAIVNPKSGCMSYENDGITVLLIEQHRIIAVVNKD